MKITKRQLVKLINEQLGLIHFKLPGKSKNKRLPKPGETWQNSSFEKAVIYSVRRYPQDKKLLPLHTIVFFHDEKNKLKEKYLDIFMNEFKFYLK